MLVKSGEFVFFIVNEGNLDLLKQEIKSKYGFLNFAYSTDRFVTYKATEDISLSGISVVFSTCHGKSLGKYNENIEVDAREVFCFSLTEDKSVKEFNVSTNKGSNQYLNIIKIKDSEYWMGASLMPPSLPGIELPKEAPSRAWLKIAEAVQVLGLRISMNQKWLELGSAPGGASYFLLQNKARVWGNDPAKMDEACLSNKSFRHIAKPVQYLKKDDLPSGMEWITVDLNLNPLQVIKEISRILRFQRNVKGILLTVKIVKPKHVDFISNNIKALKDLGFKNARALQLPSHKREYLIYACKK